MDDFFLNISKELAITYGLDLNRPTGKIIDDIYIFRNM